MSTTYGITTICYYYFFLVILMLQPCVFVIGFAFFIEAHPGLAYLLGQSDDEIEGCTANAIVIVIPGEPPCETRDPGDAMIKTLGIKSLGPGSARLR